MLCKPGHPRKTRKEAIRCIAARDSEDGLLKEEAENEPLPGEAALRAAVDSLGAAFPTAQVTTYLNTLWLQDPERWAALERIAP